MRATSHIFLIRGFTVVYRCASRLLYSISPFVLSEVSLWTPTFVLGSLLEVKLMWKPIRLQSNPYCPLANTIGLSASFFCWPLQHLLSADNLYLLEIYNLQVLFILFLQSVRLLTNSKKYFQWPTFWDPKADTRIFPPKKILSESRLRCELCKKNFLISNERCTLKKK
jgi:hypothetical protein